MGQKKITDLQLVDVLTDDFNLPTDDSIQSYRMTLAQLFVYVANKFTSLTGVTPLAADSLPIIDASDSNKGKKATIASLRNAVFRSVTTTDAVGADDETMYLSGSSFTSTLPTAVGCAGKRYRFIHGGTGLSNLYTLATTSAQTIGGIASGAFVLWTRGEILEVQSDNANWMIVGRHASTQWEAYSPSFNGMGSPSDIFAYWRREGTECLVQMQIGTMGTVSAAEARVGLPGAGAISTPSSGALSPTSQPCGTFVSSSIDYAPQIAPGIQRGVGYFTFLENRGGQNTAVTRNGNDIFNTGQLYQFQARAPISGWQP